MAYNHAAGGNNLSRDQQLQRDIDEFLSQKFVMNRIHERFADLPSIIEESYSDDFPDDCNLNNPAIILSIFPDDTLVELGRYAIPMISSGFSQLGAGFLFVLAFNLKDNKDLWPVFYRNENHLTVEDIPHDELSQTVLSPQSVHQMMPEPDDIPTAAREYCYLAASMLRLFTKSEHDYVRDFNHIVAEYSNFYGKKMTISPPRPTIDAIKTLSYQFSRGGGIFKSTLFRILHNGGGIDRAVRLRQFLYEMHLVNTGMHAFGIFVKLCGKIGCMPRSLLTALWSGEYDRQINALVKMVTIMARPGPKHQRRMWRYGRIFDERFMLPLQTRTCPAFTFILAAALKMEDPQNNRNILDIAKFADISAQRRREYTAVAENVIRVARSSLTNQHT